MRHRSRAFELARAPARGCLAGRCCLIIWLVCGPFVPAMAGDAPSTQLEFPSVEVWSGVDVTGNTVSVYAGSTYAPSESLLRDGIRLRTAAGLGRYRYEAIITGPGGARQREISGEHEFADFLVGYQLHTGQATLKAFGGVTYSEHQLSPQDPGNKVSDGKLGFKTALEMWLDIDHRLWTSVDLAYATGNNDFYGRVRAGYRLTKSLSVGPKAGAFGNREFAGGRAGAFLRYEWESGELSISGGLSGDIAEPSNPYGLLNIVQKF